MKKVVLLILFALSFAVHSALATARAESTSVEKNLLSGSEKAITCTIEYLDKITILNRGDKVTLHFNVDNTFYSASNNNQSLNDLFKPYGVKFSINTVAKKSEDSILVFSDDSTFTISLSKLGEGLFLFSGTYYYLYDCVETSHDFNLDF